MYLNNYTYQFILVSLKDDGQMTGQ